MIRENIIFLKLPKLIYEEELAEIEDNDKLDRIAAVFEERYNEEFYDEDD